MTTRVEFIVAALIITCALAVFAGRRYRHVSLPNDVYFRMQFSLVLTCIAGILYNYCKLETSSTVQVGFSGSMALFSMSMMLTMYYFYKYIRSYAVTANLFQGGNFKWLMLDYISVFVSAVISVLFIINIFAENVIYLKPNGIVVRGSLYYVTGIALIIYFIVFIAAAVLNRKAMTEMQFWAIICGIIIWIATEIIEIVFFSEYSLVLFGICIALILIEASLESVDFRALQNSIGELEKSKAEAYALKNEAERASMVKEDFLARISHELRTPLTSAQGINELIIRDSSESVIRKYAMDVCLAQNSLTDIIEELIDYSELESGEIQWDEEKYNLKDIIREMWICFDEATKAKQITLKFEIDEKVPAGLVGDAVKLRKILFNLISNAVKYTQKGSVIFNVELVESDGARVKLGFKVKDTGCGIREDDLFKIYDAFEKSEERTTRNIAGIGLGISIAQRFLKLVDSSVIVHSEYGVGSEFSFELWQEVYKHSSISNWMDDDSSADGVNKAREMIIAPTATVLVVDDNKMNLMLFEMLIKNTHIQIACAESGKEALEFSQVRKFDVIFMDHLMPELDGVEAMKIIKNRGDYNTDTPFVALTANCIKGAYEEYIRQGFSDVIFKPYTFDQINRFLWRYIPIEKIENV